MKRAQLLELKTALLEFAERTKFRRKLTVFEGRVKLDEIKQRLDAAEMSYVEDVSVHSRI